MKRKLLLSSAVVPALLASGAMGQVINFHDDDNFVTISPAGNFNNGADHCEMFAGQGAYSDPGNNIWNGFAEANTGYGSTDMYGGSWPQQPGNPGNPYAAIFSGTAWVTSDGPSLFASGGSPTNSGDADSSGLWTQVTLNVGGYSSDTTIAPTQVPNGAPVFLFSTAADVLAAGAISNEVFTLQNVPPGTYGLYLYGAAPDNNRGTTFSVNSGNAHNGISSTLNAGVTGKPAQTFVEGQNFVIWENVTPDAGSNIVITASPNSLDGVGNSNLTGHADVNGFQLIFHPPPTAQGMTSAQNVFAGGTANFSFSPVFAAGATFQWQSVIGGVTNNLSNGGDFTGATTTNLTIANAASHVGLYQCELTIAGTATNTGPAAPLTVLTSLATGVLQSGEPASAVGNILQYGDLITDEDNTNLIRGEVYDSVPPPFNMTYTNVEDNTLLQYVNLGANGDSGPFQGPVALIVTPKIGSTIVTGMRLFAANSHPEDDPADYLLEGSTDGSNFTSIAGGLLAIPAARNAAGGPINITNQVLQEIDFANTSSYSTYRLTFTNLNDDNATNGMQLAELQLLGSFPAVAPGIISQPPASEILLAGATLNLNVVASGAGPFSYAWSYNSSPILTATNATYMLPNVEAINDGAYFCKITNPSGSTNTVTMNLTVIPATTYEAAVLADQPLAFFPLNETSGTVAFDIVGGYNGAYLNLPTLNVAGPSSFLPAAASFDGTTNYVLVPNEPGLNFGGLTTLEAWVQPQGAQAGAEGDILAKGYDASQNGDELEIRVNNSTNFYGGFSDSTVGGTGLSGGLVTANWTYVAMTWDGTKYNLYVNGLSVGTFPNGLGPVAFSDPWGIGNGTASGDTRYYAGNISAAAIYNHALTPSEVEAHYDIGLFGTTNVPPAVDVPSAPVTVDLDGNGSVASMVVNGPGPFTYQWYYVVGGVTNTLAGATNGSLSLTDIQSAQGNYDYFVVVSNSFGSATSADVTLNIISGAPVVTADITPLLNYVAVGQSLTFSVAAGGTEPFFYQWSTQSGPLAGATNSSYTFNVLGGSNNYSLSISNSVGSTASSTAIVVGVTNPPPVVTFNGNGTGWTFNQAAGWPGSPNDPGVTDDVLTLIDGINGESCSAFYDTPQPIDSFLASFTFKEAPGDAPLADGATFCIQNTENAADTIGGGGGGLGFTSITPAIALEINVYAGDHAGPWIVFGTNGDVPDNDGALTNYFTPTPVDIDSGDPILIQFYYSQGAATLVLQDAIAQTTFTTNIIIGDIPTILGSSNGYVGFTAGDGALNAILTVSNFVFQPLAASASPTSPTLSIALGAPGSGTVVLSWPVAGTTGFVLEQSSAVNGPWSNAGGSTVVNGSQNQDTLTPGVGPVYYRLELP